MVLQSQVTSITLASGDVAFLFIKIHFFLASNSFCAKMTIEKIREDGYENF